MSAATDYLSAEQPIMDRLAELTSIKHVFDWADLESLTNDARKAKTPAAAVIYVGDTAIQVSGSGQADRIGQAWVVAVIVKSSAGQASGSGARESAGSILVEVRNLLSGWQPTPNHSPLKRVPGPPPAYEAAPFGFFFLQFETTFSLNN